MDYTQASGMVIEKADVFLGVTTLCSVIAIMSGALILLWKIIRSYAERDAKGLEECREAHQQTQDKLLEVTEEHGKLMGRLDTMEVLCKDALMANVKKGD